MMNINITIIHMGMKVKACVESISTIVALFYASVMLHYCCSTQ